MSNNLEKQVVYERLENGVDVHLLKTKTKNLVVASVAIPLGTAGGCTEKVMTLALAELLFPLGTKNLKKSSVEDYFEGLGADVGLHVGKEYITVTLSTCKQVFPEAFSLLMKVMIAPRFTKKDFFIAKDRLTNKLLHAKESTRSQASIALAQAQFLKGHPQWLQDTSTSLSELQNITLDEVAHAYSVWPAGVGTIALVAGDVDPKQTMQVMKHSLPLLPNKVPGGNTKRFDITKRALSPKKDIIVSMEGKHNVDTVFGIPLSIAITDSLFLPLSVGARILGGSSSSRLYTSLRTKQSLTYGAYAGLSGFSKLYTGTLSGMAVFPSNVFQKGKRALRDEIETFIEKGVTPRELTELKEEQQGSFTIGLSSTVGVHGAIFTALVQGRSLSYLDTYVEEVKNLTTQRVNLAIRNHVNLQELTIVGAGAIDEKGLPL